MWLTLTIVSTSALTPSVHSSAAATMDIHSLVMGGLVWIPTNARSEHTTASKSVSIFQWEMGSGASVMWVTSSTVIKERAVVS